MLKEGYKLEDDNYFPELFLKKQIVIGNTLYDDMDHFTLWKNKLNGKFKGTASYTILLNGDVYNHFDPEYYSEFINIGDLDKNIISIVLENVGWLVKDKYLIDWRGSKYTKKKSNIFYSRWRKKEIWAAYSEKQLDSLVELCKELANKFDIPLISSTHNTKINDISEKQGIYYRSNYSSNYLDVSPAFDFNNFKDKIEK